MNRYGMSEETRKIYDTLMEKGGIAKRLRAFESAGSIEEANRIFNDMYKEKEGDGTPSILACSSAQVGLFSSAAPLDGFKEHIIAYTEYKIISNGKEVVEHSAVCVYAYPEDKRDR